mmetsp:Transcript_32500/g.91313  ORF Transcript_32500/g.91313 Transcript_32500/m.91313 type:complete len:1049 (-) Transcript_32500:210-3356(-)
MDRPMLASRRKAALPLLFGLSLLVAACWVSLRPPAAPSVGSSRGPRSGSLRAFVGRGPQSAASPPSSSGGRSAARAKGAAAAVVVEVEVTDAVHADAVPVDKKTPKLSAKAVKQLRIIDEYLARTRTLAREALTWLHISERQRLLYIANILFDVVLFSDAPLWLHGREKLTEQDHFIDLVSLHSEHAMKVSSDDVLDEESVLQFIHSSSEILPRARRTIVTTEGCELSEEVESLLAENDIEHAVLYNSDIKDVVDSITADGTHFVGGYTKDFIKMKDVNKTMRQCQKDCLEACMNGARKIQMACGTGKTLVMREIANRAKGKVLMLVPSLVLLHQHAKLFPDFCLVGTGYNDKIRLDAAGFIAVYPSAHLLRNVSFSDILMDEAHHRMPQDVPTAGSTYLFSATHYGELDFDYSTDKAIQEGFLCDYDLFIPIVDDDRIHEGLVSLLKKKAGQFRRILAFCNSTKEALIFENEVKNAGLAAWHITADTQKEARGKAIADFAGPMHKPAHVMVSVRVLGEGVDIPNADTCLFVQPRGSHVSIMQAIGRVLRLHPSKPVSHIILPALQATDIAQLKKACDRQDAGALAEMTEDGSAASETRLRIWALQAFVSTLAHADSRLHGIVKGKGLERFTVLDAREVKSEMTEGFRQSIFFADVKKFVLSSLSSHFRLEAKLHKLLHKLKAFMKKEERLPLRQSTDAEERELAEFLRDQQHTFCEDKLSALQVGLLGSVHPMMKDQMERWKLDVWKDNLDDLASFVTQMRRMPEKVSEYDVERTLAAWVEQQQKVIKEMHPERVDALRNSHNIIEKRVSAWLFTWDAFLPELKEFLEKNGHLPHEWSTNSDESRLAEFLTNQAAVAFRQLKSQKYLEHLAKLDDLKGFHPLLARRIDKWIKHSGKTRRTSWQIKLEELTAFVERFDRLPISGTNGVEEKLSEWIEKQGRALSGLTEENLKAIEYAHPRMKELVDGWMQPTEERMGTRPAVKKKWKVFFKEVTEFRDRHGRSPEKGTDQQESGLADWLFQQRAKYKTGQLKPERCEMLEIVIPSLAR